MDEASDEMSHGWRQEGHHRSGLLPVPAARGRHLGLSRKPKVQKIVCHGVDVLSN